MTPTPELGRAETVVTVAERGMTAGDVMFVIGLVLAAASVYATIGAAVAGLMARVGWLDELRTDEVVLTAMFWPLVVLLIFPMLIARGLFRWIVG